MAARELQLFKNVGQVTFNDRTASGIASPFYELDRHGDMMLPGCYRSAAPAFVASEAVVMLSHYEPLPIGICTKAEEVSAGLAVEFKYHSTDRAEEAYTVAKERQQMGKGTGLSVGIRLEKQGYEGFENGQQLLTWLEEEGHDLGLVKNVDAVRSYSRYCWAIKRVGELFEFSQVCVGAARGALATQIKHVFGGDRSHADLASDELLEMLLAGVDVGVDRLESIQETRAKDGRAVGAETLRKAKSLHQKLGDLIDLAKGATAPDPLSIRQAQLRAKAFLMENNL